MAGEQKLLSRTVAKRPAASKQSREEYEKLLDSYSHFAALNAGDVLKGRILPEQGALARLP